MKKVNSILDFADGASVERINYELQKILENVVHPNTDDKPRKLTIEITITQQNELRTEDNGITQQVVAKQGAALGAVKVSPIWELAPYRTFTEITQPTSLFLLRLKQAGEGSEFALFETDGGKWAIDAMSYIKLYLTNAFLNKDYDNKVFVL